MKNIIYCLSVACLVLAGGLLIPVHALAQLGIQPLAESAAAPGRIVLLATDGYVPSIVSLFPDISFRALKQYDSWKVKALTDEIGAKFPADKIAGSMLRNLYILTFPDTVDVLGVVRQLKDDDRLAAVEPDYRIQLFELPADPLFSNQWYFSNHGQPFYAIQRVAGDHNDVLYQKTGVPGEDVNLVPVYDNPPPDSAETIVAIVDTGIDYKHPELATKIYQNPFEIAGNGIDDDHNGYVDDTSGWDFSGDSLDIFNIRPDNDATDSVGHGTHIAGIIAALQNQMGIAGYPGRLKILPVKIFPNGLNSVGIAAIIYAADMGAQVMNLSWGFPFESGILEEALAYARSRGCLPVAAAGNYGNSNRVYPAAFDETFTVGATNSDGYLTFFTTYGPFIDVVAPGQNILSLRAAGTDMYADAGEPGVRIIDNLYYLSDGTSMAAPMVVGAAGMLLSFQPGLTIERIESVLRESADDLVDPFNEGDSYPGYDTLSGWGKLNVAAALNQTLTPSAAIASPLEMQVVSGDVPISLEITGGYSGPTDLYLGDGKFPASWELLHSVTSLDQTDPFFVWSSAGQSGYFTLRIVTEHGEDELTVRAVNEERCEIVAPIDDEELRYVTEVRSNAYGQDYDSAVVAFRAEGTALYERIGKSTAYLFDETSVEWALASMKEGFYILRQTAYFADHELSDSVRIFVRSLMRSGFPVSVRDFAAFSPGVADITGDGIEEIVLGCRKGLYAWTADGQLLPGFPVLPNDDMRSMPGFDDIDGDGIQDIIITGDTLVACFNYLGEALPGWPRKASTGLSFSSFPIPVPTELYDQRDSVILYMSRFGEVHAFEFDGDSYFYSLDGLFTALDPNIFDTAAYVGLSVPFVTAVNLDESGTNEVLAIYSTSEDPSGVYVWDGRNGLPPFDWESPLARKIRQSSGGMLADIDDDGLYEVIMAGQDSDFVTGLWVTKNGRDDMPGWPVYFDGLNDWIGTAPVCADIDGNGTKEVVVAFFSFDISRIYAFNADGTPYIENPNLPYGLMLSTSTTLSNIIVGDIDGDGIPNLVSRGGYIFPGTGYERIYAWEPNGRLTPGFPIVTPTSPSDVVSTLFTPVITDLEGDGKTEVVMSGDGKNLFVYDLETAYSPDATPWPKYQGDAKNTGINHNRKIPTDVDDNPTAVPFRFAILGNAPNPFNPSTRIEFMLDRAEDVTLTVFNVLGQRVIELSSGYLPAGKHVITWDGTNYAGQTVAAGVYFARLSADKRTSTRKMVLLK